MEPIQFTWKIEPEDTPIEGNVLQAREIVTNPDYLRSVAFNVAEQICEQAFDADETLPETPDEAAERFVADE